MENYRNHELLALAKLAPVCMGCGNPNKGDVVAAHRNEGKALGSKNPDYMMAFLGSLCCHAPLDQGSTWTREERRAFWMAAFWRTQEWLWRSGHVAAHATPQPQPIPKPKRVRAMPKGRKIASGPKLQGRAFTKSATHKRTVGGAVIIRKPKA